MMIASAEAVPEVDDAYHWICRQPSAGTAAGARCQGEHYLDRDTLLDSELITSDLMSQGTIGNDRRLDAAAVRRFGMALEQAAETLAPDHPMFAYLSHDECTALNQARYIATRLATCIASSQAVQNDDAVGEDDSLWPFDRLLGPAQVREQLDRCRAWAAYLAENGREPGNVTELANAYALSPTREKHQALCDVIESGLHTPGTDLSDFLGFWNDWLRSRSYRSLVQVITGASVPIPGRR